MSETNQKPITSGVSRRDFAKAATTIAAASTVALNVPFVHAQGSDTVSIALVGCGGRGTGAAQNALATTSGPVKLTAMADVFESRLSGSLASLKKGKPELVDVPEDRRFVGFEGYRQAIDCLKPGDVAIFATPPAFRWVHFKYAIQKGVNVFMEKPVTVDGPSTRKMLALGDEAIRKNLKVGVGLMCRHCDVRKALYDRIKGGAIGDIVAMRAYRMHGPVGKCFALPEPENLSETLYQIREFHSFLWASGGLYSDFYIHNIDECCMMKDSWPVKAQALGGRHYRGEAVDQNFDTYDVEYTFADGAKLFFNGRTMLGAHEEFASYAHGTKGSAIISARSHTPAKCRTFRGQNMTAAETTWAFPEPEPNPYQLEWDHLIESIRKDRFHNEVKRGAEASLVTSMGRMAAHTGQVITYDQILNSEHEFAPNVDELTPDGPAPVMPGADGKYPQPQPGVVKDREY